MTYIFLKVTEMLCIRDPNVNARFHPGDEQRHLSEAPVRGEPDHRGHAVHAQRQGGHGVSGRSSTIDIRDLRNWSATGCVEPTLSGKHIGHTNLQMMNMVAALEMALNNGRHPLMNWKVGPDTGVIEQRRLSRPSTIFSTPSPRSSAFIIDQSIEYNNMLAKAHQDLRPTPLLSSLIDGLHRERDGT